MKLTKEEVLASIDNCIDQVHEHDSEAAMKMLMIYAGLWLAIHRGIVEVADD